MTHTESVGRLDELRRGRVYGCQIAGVEIVYVRVGDEVYACGGICSHNGAYLEMGQLAGHELICPLHSGRFDVRTGEATKRPASYPVQSYAVAIEDGSVYVSVDVEDEAATV